MTDRSRDQSIDAEPHLQNRPFEVDPSEHLSEARLRREAKRATTEDAVEHTVWDEAALSAELAGSAADGDLTYAAWLRQKQAETSWSKSLCVTLLIALIAGPWGVVGALAGGGEGVAGLAMVVFVGPVTEEIMKVAAALWVVEKRPYLFKSLWQILLCAVVGGAAFGFIENLMYLYVYLPDHSAKLAAWRWTVCTGLHMNSSFVAGVGLARIWDNAVREQHRPQLWLGLPWLVIAMIAHGTYNAAVTLAEAMNWLEL